MKAHDAEKDITTRALELKLLSNRGQDLEAKIETKLIDLFDDVGRCADMQFQREPQALQDDLENQTVEQLNRLLLSKVSYGQRDWSLFFGIPDSEEMQRISLLLLSSAPHWTFEVENLKLV